MSNKVKIILAAVVVVLVVGGVGFWYFVVRDDAPPEASLDAIGTDRTSTTTGDGGSGGGDPVTLDGTWKVEQGDDVFVGYRVRELFAGDTIKKTAAGRTSEVEGSLTIAGDQVSAVDITADVTALKSDQARRDSAISMRGLQTEQFPEATFELTEPITLPNTEQGKEIDVTATGDLTLHGETKAVDVDLQAQWDGSTIKVAGSTPVTFADYGIGTIEIPGFVKTDDNGTMELQLLFTK
jgi:polyisoprenoid-binding protein YceI